jgi:hypothetical protein
VALLSPVCFYLLLALLAAFLAIFGQYKERNRKHPPSLRYFKYRVGVQLDLNAKQYNGQTLMGSILEYLRLVFIKTCLLAFSYLTFFSPLICAELDGEKNIAETKEKIVINTGSTGMVKDFKKDLKFETSSRIMSSPMDIMRRRSAARLQQIIDSPQHIIDSHSNCFRVF